MCRYPCMSSVLHTVHLGESPFLYIPYLNKLRRHRRGDLDEVETSTPVQKHPSVTDLYRV